MVLGSLMNVANAMETTRITSPLYMPKAGDTLSETKLGYYDEDYKYDRYSGTTDDYGADVSHMTIREDMSYGIRDDWSFNFGFVFDFDQERDRDYATNTNDTSYEDDADFHNTYFGLTKRFIDNTFKLDGMAKIYMQENDNTFAESNSLPRNESVEVAVRAGFEVYEDMYDTALTLGYKFMAEDTATSSTSATTTESETDNQMDWYVKWENQFNPIAGFDFGVNVEYRKIDEYESVSKTAGVINVGTSSFEIQKHDVWTYDADVNYTFKEKYAVGAYIEYKDYENVAAYLLNASGGIGATPYSTDKDRDSMEYGIKTSIKF